MEYKKFAALLAAVSLLAVGISGAQAQNLLTDGDFEAADVDLPEVPGWSLEESVTDMPGVSVNSAELIDFGNPPGEPEGGHLLWLRPFVGNQGGLMNERTNAFLSQSVPGVAGEEYTFSGWSRFEPNFSGGVEFLDSFSPSGSVESPTQTMWELAFLDANDEVIGTPVTLDLREDRPAPINDAEWRQHTLMGTAPAGTSNVRVTAAATDLITNVDPQQSGMYDRFSLITGSSPATELLMNPGLNELPEEPPELEAWTLVETPEGTDNAGLGGGFANDPATGGNFGFWLKAFANGDATLSQTVSGVAGGDYTFTASSAFGQNYSGGQAGTTTETFLELAFLDAAEEVIGEPLTLDLVDAGQTNAAGPIADHPEAWQQFSLDGTAPDGTTFVRVSAGATGMFETMNPDQGAFFDDFSLTLAGAGVAGDYNGNGTVDAADYVLWRNGGPLQNEVDNPGTVDDADYDAWRARFGNSAGGGSQSLGSAAVPEPAAWYLVAIGLLAGLGIRRG